MFPEPLFHLGPWPVAAYTLCHLLAVVVFAALVLGRRDRSADIPVRSEAAGKGGGQECPRSPDHAPASWTAAVLCRFLAAVLAGAWLGSWLVVALLSGTLLSGGHSSLGALAGALLAAVWLARRERSDTLRRLDWLVPALAAADATARLGCFAAGCCHGRPAWGLPWAVNFPMESACLFPGVPVHPTQLYLSLGGFSLAALLLWLARRGATARATFSLFLAGTGAMRLLVEPLRSPPFDNPFSTIASVTFLLAGIALLTLRRSGASAERRHSPSGREVRRSPEPPLSQMEPTPPTPA